MTPAVLKANDGRFVQSKHVVQHTFKIVPRYFHVHYTLL